MTAQPAAVTVPVAAVPAAAASAREPKYRRVLLKLSGEALMGEDSYGINREVIDRIVAEIAEVVRLGVEVAVVIGGGNIFRGVAPGRRGDGPRDRRLHGHAGHADERARAAGRAAARRRGIARAVGAADRPGRRALHPRPRAAPPRGAQGRDLRRRHRQSVLHDGHRRRAARPRDGRRHRAEGDQGRRRLHGRSEEGPDRRRATPSSRSTRRSSRTSR